MSDIYKSTGHLIWAMKCSNSYKKCQNYVQNVDIVLFTKHHVYPIWIIKYSNSYKKNHKIG